jgi:hypothetical protein
MKIFQSSCQVVAMIFPQTTCSYENLPIELSSCSYDQIKSNQIKSISALSMRECVRSELSQDSTFILSALSFWVHSSLSLSCCPVLSCPVPSLSSYCMSFWAHSLSSKIKKDVISDKKELTFMGIEPTTLYSATHALTNWATIHIQSVSRI